MSIALLPKPSIRPSLPFPVIVFCMMTWGGHIMRSSRSAPACWPDNRWYDLELSGGIMWFQLINMHKALWRPKCSATSFSWLYVCMIRLCMSGNSFEDLNLHKTAHFKFQFPSTLLNHAMNNNLHNKQHMAMTMTMDIISYHLMSTTDCLLELA